MLKVAVNIIILKANPYYNFQVFRLRLQKNRKTLYILKAVKNNLIKAFFDFKMTIISAASTIKEIKELMK